MEMRVGKSQISIVIVAIGMISAGLTLPTSNSSEASVGKPSSTSTRSVQIELPETTEHEVIRESDTPAEEALSWKHYKVKKGDSMALIFRRAGESAKTLHAIMNSGPAAKQLAHLKVGQSVAFGYSAEQNFQQLKFSPAKTEQLIVTRQEDNWISEIINEDVEIRIEHAAATINDSLFLSGSKAGLSDNTIMLLAGIFGWDIDFALDIRKGDQFTVIYEGRYLDGEKIGDGEIIAAEFINQGKSYQAVRYTDAEDDTQYYSPEGRSMRKAFLRTPVKFSRISSKFTKKRWHPVLKKWRSHRGVDYAAPRGTPVKATSNGKIAFKGNKGGYGKSIFIQHGKKYTTVYGHLNSYAKGIGKGKKVKQGQVIGYVGSTGLATGPHLHYELRVNGVHHNPLTIKLPKASSIDNKYLDDFRQQSQPLLARLALINATQVASTAAEPELSLPN
jgi:murein DD-endopeptidase MepM/ murein hydrolase activator NlpD